MDHGNNTTLFFFSSLGSLPDSFKFFISENLWPVLLLKLIHAYLRYQGYLKKEKETTTTTTKLKTVTL